MTIVLMRFPHRRKALAGSLFGESGLDILASRDLDGVLDRGMETGSCQGVRQGLGDCSFDGLCVHKNLKRKRPHEVRYGDRPVRESDLFRPDLRVLQDEAHSHVDQKRPIELHDCPPSALKDTAGV